MSDDLSRRAVGGLALTVLAAGTALAQGPAPASTGRFGQVNKLIVKPGQHAALRERLRAIIAMLPTALSYDVLEDPARPDAIWTVELWRDADAHRVAVAAPAVQAAIGAIKPMVARFENIATFRTV